ncbi:hypothetical protein GJ744_009180 [Endocarpon pusillum]|uniref:Uncharacterized protein n=1 Tax=Endocarpon pusillum TaxID=364733 RepID=A0A8H7E3X6_9EURO|nr:hypothetical protein GJ744_009180 [Endocarpon pusillum]
MSLQPYSGSIIEFGALSSPVTQVPQSPVIQVTQAPSPVTQVPSSLLYLTPTTFSSLLSSSPAVLLPAPSTVLTTGVTRESIQQGNPLPSVVVTTSTNSPRSSDLDARTTELVTSSQISSASTSPPPPPPAAGSLSAGAGAGIGIAVLILLLASIGGITYFLWRRRRRRLQARAEMTRYEEKPQLGDTSIVPGNKGFGIARISTEDRHELEGSSTAQFSPKGPPELRAGPYSNRHELEGRHR